MDYSASNTVRHEKFENNSDDDLRDLERFLSEPITEDVTDEEVIRSLEDAVPEKGVSRKVTKPAAGTDAADKETLKIIRDYGLVQVVVGSRTVRNFTPSLNLPKLTYKARTGTKPKPSNDNALPHWDHSGDRLKFGMAMQSLSERGCAFTLLFGPDRLKELLSHPKGFSRALALYIDRALDRRLGRVPDYGFVVEMTVRGKLHIHGGIETTSDVLSMVKAALEHAGGKGWIPSRPGEKQVHFRDLFYPTGWTRYSFEDNPKARRIIKGNTVVISNPLRRSAKQLYGAVKKTIDRGRSTKSAP